MTVDTSKSIKYPYDGVIFHKDVTLYQYDITTGRFTKHPYVFIFHMINPFTKEEYDNYFAVGLSNAKHRREVCSMSNVVFCDAGYNDLLLWTTNMSEPDVKNIFKDYVKAMCNAKLANYFTGLNDIKDIFNTMAHNLGNGDEGTTPMSLEETMCTMRSYVFSR